MSQVTVIIAFLVKLISAQAACLPFTICIKLLFVVRCVLLAILLYC